MNIGELIKNQGNLKNDRNSLKTQSILKNRFKKRETETPLLKNTEEDDMDRGTFDLAGESDGRLPSSSLFDASVGKRSNMTLNNFRSAVTRFQHQSLQEDPG